MGLETATYIQDLVSTNPVSPDDVGQGDDHLRLIKTVLKNTFPSATKPIRNSTVTAKSANFTILSTEDNVTFTVSTGGGAVVGTLPSLAAGDAGWQCFFIKLDSANTFHVAPASGNVISGLVFVTKARRCIPNIKFAAIWTGSNWYIERIAREPIGSMIIHYYNGLPVGYEWPNGQTLASASTNYQEYNSLIGSGATVDMRGRAPFGRDDMGGAAAGRITAAESGITGTTLGAGGGVEAYAITTSELPASGLSFTTGTESALHSHSGTTDSGGVDHTHDFLDNQFGGGGLGVAGGGTGIGGNDAARTTTAASAYLHTHTFTTGTESALHTHSGTTSNMGSGLTHQNMPPALIVNYALVVE